MIDDASDTSFPTLRDDYVQVPNEDENVTAQTASPTYRLAFVDDDFLLRPDLRAVRLQLELLKPELLQQEQGIRSTIAMFGSARIPDPESARANVEKAEQQARSHPRDKRIGLNIVLPHEQSPNSYITPELCFRFHYLGYVDQRSVN